VLDDGATAPEVGDGHSLVWCEPPTMALDPIVQMMGGRIWVVSTPGQVSAFHFTSSFGMAAPSGSQRPMETAHLTGHVLPRERRFLHILLAEDNAVNQLVASRLLQKQGHHVVTSGNGREALERLSQEPFDVILMDVQMPEMDGFQATAAIRKKEATTGARIPIIAP